MGAGSDQATRVANRTNAKIAEALGNIGDAKAGPTLLRLARANDDYVRLSAVQALGLVHDASAVPELAHIVDDPAAPPILMEAVRNWLLECAFVPAQLDGRAVPVKIVQPFIFRLR